MLIIILIVILSACQSVVKKANEPSSQHNAFDSDTILSSEDERQKANEPSSQQNAIDTDTSTLSDDNRPKAAWLLTGHIGQEDPVQFLTNLDDPSGQSYIRIDDLVDAMQTNEERLKFRDYHTDIGRITSDGSRMAVFRVKMDESQLVVQVYDLNRGRKEGEFNITGGYPIISSDLSRYLYDKDGVIYMYDTQNKQTTHVKLNLKDIDIASIINGKYSPDGTQFSFVNHRTGSIDVLDLSDKGGITKLPTGSNVIYIMQWNTDNQIIYTRQNEQDTDSLYMYKLDIENEREQQIGEYRGSSIFSANGEELVFLDDEVRTHLLDISSNSDSDISTIVQNESTWAVPMQWIDTTTDYMKYRN